MKVVGTHLDCYQHSQIFTLFTHQENIRYAIQFFLDQILNMHRWYILTTGGNDNLLWTSSYVNVTFVINVANIAGV